MKGLKMDNEQVIALLKYIEVGTRVLSARIVLIVTLLLGYSLFAWAMYDPNYNRITIATIFAVFVYIPIVMMDKKHTDGRKIISQEE